MNKVYKVIGCRVDWTERMETEFAKVQDIVSRITVKIEGRDRAYTLLIQKRAK